MKRTPLFPTQAAPTPDPDELLALARRAPEDGDAARAYLLAAARRGELDPAVRRLRLGIHPGGAAESAFLGAVRDAGFGLGDPHLQFPAPLASAALAPDRRHLAVLLVDGTLDLYRLADPRDLTRYRFGAGRGAVAFAADSASLGVLTPGPDGPRGARITLDDPPRLAPLAFPGPAGPAFAVLGASPDLGTWVVADPTRAHLLRAGTGPSPALALGSGAGEPRAARFSAAGDAVVVERTVGPGRSAYTFLDVEGARATPIHPSFAPDLAWSFAADGSLALGARQADGIESEDDPWAPFPRLVPWLHVLVFDRPAGRRIGELAAEGDSRTCAFDPEGGIRLGTTRVGPDLAPDPTFKCRGEAAGSEGWRLPPPAWQGDFTDAPRPPDLPAALRAPLGGGSPLVELEVLADGRVRARDDSGADLLWTLVGPWRPPVRLPRDDSSYRVLAADGTVAVRMTPAGNLVVSDLADPGGDRRFLLGRDQHESFHALALLPGAAGLVVFSDHGRVSRLELASGTVRAHRTLPGPRIRRAGATPDGRWVWAVREAEAGLLVLDAGDLSVRLALDVERFSTSLPVLGLPDRGLLLTRTAQALLVLDPAAGTTRELLPRSARPGPMACTPDAGELALVDAGVPGTPTPTLARFALVGSGAGTLGLDPRPAPPPPGGPIRALAYAPDGARLLVTQQAHVRVLTLP